MTDARYAAFTSRGSKWGPSRTHVYKRSSQPTVLGDYASVCGSAHGLGTVGEFALFCRPSTSEAAERRCKRCIAWVAGMFEEVQT